MRIAHPAMTAALAVVAVGAAAAPLAVAALAAHAGAVPTAAEEPRRDLVLGSLAPETGEYAPVEASLRAPVRMAVDEINAAGGIGRGRRVRLVTADESIEHRGAARAARRLVAVHHVDAIIGPATSSDALAVLDALAGEALVCSGSNTSAALSTAGREHPANLYFRTSPPDRLQATALARLVLADRHRRVGVVHSSDASPRALAASTARTLQGQRIRTITAAFDPGSDPGPAVQRVLRARPDAVVVTADSADGARVVRALLRRGAAPGTLPVYASDGLFAPGFAEDVDASDAAAVAGLRGTVPATDPGGTDSAFDRAFAATTTDPFFSSYYYDCTVLTALAAVKAKSDDPKKMAAAFAANVTGTHDCDTFADCKRLLGRGRSVHYRGASSRFDRWSGFEPAEGVYDVWAYGPSGAVALSPPERQIRVP